jgi:ABC-type multidrug transport system, ATPase component
VLFLVTCLLMDDHLLQTLLVVLHTVCYLSSFHAFFANWSHNVAEQTDVHEGTATVREAMRFSAYLRQPSTVSEKEKDDYVEEVIALLELQELADAVVNSLNLEARKRLTIGVE